MIVQMLKQRIVPDQTMLHICQIVCSVVAGLVLWVGFRRLASMDLTESQLFSACVRTLVLAGVFIVLGFQCRAWRRSIRPKQPDGFKTR